MSADLRHGILHTTSNQRIQKGQSGQLSSTSKLGRLTVSSHSNGATGRPWVRYLQVYLAPAAPQDAWNMSLHLRALSGVPQTKHWRRQGGNANQWPKAIRMAPDLPHR